MNEVCNTDALNQSIVCMPLLAAASALYGRGDWLGLPLPDEPQRQAWIRTLARQMERAAREPALLAMVGA
jgi:hypothetical protein